MKTTIKSLAVVALTVATFSVASAQDDKEPVKKEIRKETTIEHIDGEKVLTIKTTKDGKTTEEIYKGVEADAKLKEMEHKKEMRHRQEMKHHKGPRPPHKPQHHDPNKKVKVTKIIEIEEIEEVEKTEDSEDDKK
ncbi:MAG: hypothetical protein ACLGGV_09580 [Bacteroidia bacterium]